MNSRTEMIREQRAQETKERGEFRAKATKEERQLAALELIADTLVDARNTLADIHTSIAIIEAKIP